MAKTPPLVERLVVGVDIESYSGRNVRHQRLVQRDLPEILDDAAEAVGLDRPSWFRQGTGDGELMVLPPDVDQATVVGRFVGEMNTGLVERNGDHAPEARIRLRVAMHVDTIIESTYSFAGPALVVVSRLLDSAPVRRALAQAQATDDTDLALIVSEVLHRKVVESGLGGIRPRSYRKVRVEAPGKAFAENAYIHVPGGKVHGVDLGDTPPPGNPNTPPGPDPFCGPTKPRPGTPPTSGRAGGPPTRTASTTTTILGHVIGGENSIGNIDLSGDDDG